ncbi:MAG: HlyD family secretion protein [Candidatus Entotheonellia bacterium]
MFSTSLHTLEADGFRGTMLGLLLAVGLLGAWGAWFIGAQVVLYAVSETARLEMSQAAHPVEAPVAGRVVTTRLVLGQEVQGGEVLVELDATAQQLQLEEEQARLSALTPQLEALRTAIAAEEQALREALHAGRVALDEARARHREAEVAARTAEEEAELFARLQARNLSSQLELLRAKAEAQKRRAAADTLRLAVSRQERDHRTQESDRNARLEGLRRDVTRLTGEMATAAATVERLAHEIERRRIRTPMAGRLGEVANLRIGSVVQEGNRLAAVVPRGDLQVVADFLPQSALGRIWPGQSARLRLEGFPWTQYGSLAATVSRVASEVRNGRVRVELSVDPDRASLIPLQHGLPGTVEVQVERVAPATLVLRTAGKLLARPVAAGQGEWRLDK